MAKMILNVKNAKDSYTKNDVMLFDGRDWYVTTKEEIVREMQTKLDEAVKRYENIYANLTNEWKKFLGDYTKQNTKLIELVEKAIQSSDKEN